MLAFRIMPGIRPYPRGRAILKDYGMTNDPENDRCRVASNRTISDFFKKLKYLARNRISQPRAMVISAFGSENSEAWRLLAGGVKKLAFSCKSKLLHSRAVQPALKRRINKAWASAPWRCPGCINPPFQGWIRKRREQPCMPPMAMSDTLKWDASWGRWFFYVHFPWLPPVLFFLFLYHNTWWLHK